MVDVRDVAQAHLEAIKRTEAANHRFMLVENGQFMSNIGKVLHDKYSSQGYNPTNREIPKSLMWLASFFNSRADGMYKRWDKQMTFENAKTREMLGIDFIPMEQSVSEMVETMIQTGYVPDLRTK